MIKSQHRINLISVFSISALMRTFLACAHTNSRSRLFLNIERKKKQKGGIIKEVERIKLLFDMEIIALSRLELRTLFNQNRVSGLQSLSCDRFLVVSKIICGDREQVSSSHGYPGSTLIRQRRLILTEVSH